MNVYANGEPVAPHLSKIITSIFGGFACVWFGEMMFLGFQSLAKIHSSMWQVPLPENPQLETVQYITWALAAPAKGALFIMAIIGLRSKNPSTRAVIFVSMSLVPPLNMAFPFRQQGFLFGPMAVAATLSTITWGSFFLTKERTQQPEPSGSGGSVQLPPSGWEIFQYGWFAVQSTSLTLLAFLLLFETRTALNLVFPCLTGVFSAQEGALSSPIHSTMAAGTHVLALAIASWIATVKCRSNPTLRRAMTFAGTVHAGLFFVFPLRQLIMDFGGACAASSLVIASVPLFVCWVVYAILDTRRTRLSANNHSPSFLPASSSEGKP